MFLVAKVNFFLQTTRSAIVFYGRGESYEEVGGGGAFKTFVRFPKRFGDLTKA